MRPVVGALGVCALAACASFSAGSDPTPAADAGPDSPTPPGAPPPPSGGDDAGETDGAAADDAPHDVPMACPPKTQASPCTGTDVCCVAINVAIASCSSRASCSAEQWSCASAANCPQHQVCCAASGATTCETTCPGRQLCAIDSECLGGKTCTSTYGDYAACSQ
ncbi:MAG TPA: hypothetical protein VIF62_02420 [Labilithrix sp.]